ncbi:MAG: glycosyltransferase family protein [Ignavibacteria bacterium]|nr:glycosyltransferase family protein [Ignavibacteria bacterium]
MSDLINKPDNALPKTVIVIQARTGSTRLPGKILLPLGGKPMLVRMYERVAASKSAQEIVVATTIDPQDDDVVKHCEENGIKCFRGHPADLLDRHYKAGIESGADVIVKIPSDCPLICPDVIDKVLNFYYSHQNDFDYVSNLHPATHPDGNDVEIMPMKILEQAWNEAERGFEREHTTPFIWERPERFRIGNVEWETGLDFSMSHRLVVDYEEDYEFVKKIFEELYENKNDFKLCDIMMLLDRKPELKEINSFRAGINWYRNYTGELKTIDPEKIRKDIQ